MSHIEKGALSFCIVLSCLLIGNMAIAENQTYCGTKNCSASLDASGNHYYAVDLDYRESRRTDQYGNLFKYRARVFDSRDSQVGRWAWDVFLVSR
jgi:hypothetical protein